jgi:mono/diheme cytochrome c family protein
MKRIAAALALLAVLSDVAFGCPVVRRVAAQTAVVSADVVVAPAVVATFVPVTVPAYSASYTPPAVCDTTELVKAVKDLTTRIAALEKSPAPPTPAPAPAPPPMPKADADPGAVKFAASCAACHDASKPKGGAPTFFRDGVELELSCEQALACVKAISEGSMPKGRQLADADAPEILIHLAKRPKK